MAACHRSSILIFPRLMAACLWIPVPEAHKQQASLNLCHASGLPVGKQDAGLNGSAGLLCSVSAGTIKMPAGSIFFCFRKAVRNTHLPFKNLSKPSRRYDRFICTLSSSYILLFSYTLLTCSSGGNFLGNAYRVLLLKDERTLEVVSEIFLPWKLTAYFGQPKDVPAHARHTHFIIPQTGVTEETASGTR